jgi:hypothetical protein
VVLIDLIEIDGALIKSTWAMKTCLVFKLEPPANAFVSAVDN